MPAAEVRLPQMGWDLQKANIWKRISAWMLDAVVLGLAAVLAALALSALTGYDGLNADYASKIQDLDENWGISHSVTKDEFEALAPEARTLYLSVAASYRRLMSCVVLITSLSLLAAHLLLEFAVPLALGDGRTLGKKIFGIALMRTDGVRVGAVCLFVRTVLGKYAIETMVPAIMLLMIFGGMIGIAGPLVVLGLGALQVALLLATRRNQLVHDLLADTVAVDFASQRIFETEDDALEFKKAAAAEAAARQTY